MSAVLIEELAGKRRTLTLRGGGLPFQGAEWGGEQVVDTVWNPGSPAATQHVLGPTEMPSDWTGEWNTTRLIRMPVLWVDGGPEQQLSLADSVRDAFDSLRFSGQLLRVTWQAKDNRRVVRYGRLTKANFPSTRADDIKWTATFTWVGRIDAAVSVVQGDQGLAASRAAMLAATDAQAEITAAEFIQTNPRLPNSATTWTLGQLEQFANGPRVLAKSFARLMDSVVSRFAALGNIVKNVVGTPAAIQEQFVDVAIDAVGAANVFIDSMSREPVEVQSLRDSVSALLRTATYYGGAMASAEVLAAAAMTVARQAQQKRTARNRPGVDPRSLAGAGDILATYVPKAGDTMTKIAIRFYTDDVSYQLCRANGLPGSTIVPPHGVALIIPLRKILDTL